MTESSLYPDQQAPPYPLETTTSSAHDQLQLWKGACGEVAYGGLGNEPPDKSHPEKINTRIYAI